MRDKSQTLLNITSSSSRLFVIAPNGKRPEIFWFGAGSLAALNFLLHKMGNAQGFSGLVQGRLQPRFFLQGPELYFWYHMGNPQGIAHLMQGQCDLYQMETSQGTAHPVRMQCRLHPRTFFLLISCTKWEIPREFLIWFRVSVA